MVVAGFRVVVTMCGALFALAATAHAGASPLQKCAAAKVKATATGLRKQLGCEGKAVSNGTGVDPICLAGAATKLTAAFAKAEAAGGCLIAGDAAPTDVAIDALVLTLVEQLPGGATAGGRKCAAAKLGAAGKKAQGLLDCARKAIGAGSAVDPACEATVMAKFAATFASVEIKQACATTGDAAAVEASIDAWVAAVGAALTSTTTTTVTTTTTTTTTASTTTTTSAPGSTTTTTAAPGTFGAVQQIFTASCALPQCHVQPVPAQDLELTPGVSYAQLVGVFSGQKTAVMRVKPGDANNSYLYRKVNGSGPQLGARMPNNGLVLSAADIASIKQWILAGALNN